MFRHVVLFKWNDDVDDAHIEAVSAGLDNLATVIEEIKDYKHGRDVGLSDQNFDYVVVGDFDSVEGYQVYRDHPVHQELIAELITGRISTRASVQYEVG
ncbi:MAG: Dabb family protein [Acidimicrobiia bacterium]|nr:Dabb family protein [Acidimicrobiia bacterium]